jgi:hypothetical protein
VRGNPAEDIKVKNGLKRLSWLRSLALVVLIGGGVLLLALNSFGQQEVAGNLFVPYVVLVVLTSMVSLYAICPYCGELFYIWWLGGTIIFFQTKCTHCGINFKGKQMPCQSRNWGE